MECSQYMAAPTANIAAATAAVKSLAPVTIIQYCLSPTFSSIFVHVPNVANVPFVF